MQNRIAYCSACDRDVHIVITDQPSADGQANLYDAEVVCLEIGHQCTGGLCPVGATTPTVMAARLVRNGLETQMNPIVPLDCPSCGESTSFLVLDALRATCTQCGSTTVWGSLRSENNDHH